MSARAEELRAILEAETYPTGALLRFLEWTLGQADLFVDTPFLPTWEDALLTILRHGAISGDFRRDEDPYRLLRTVRGACQAHLADAESDAAEHLWRLLLRGIADPPRPLR